MRPGRHQKFCRTDPTARLVWERVSLALRMTALTGRSCTCSGCREGLSLPSAPEHAPRSVTTAGKILKKIDKSLSHCRVCHHHYSRPLCRKNPTLKLSGSSRRLLAQYSG